ADDETEADDDSTDKQKDAKKTNNKKTPAAAGGEKKQAAKKGTTPKNTKDTKEGEAEDDKKHLKWKDIEKADKGKATDSPTKEAKRADDMDSLNSETSKHRLMSETETPKSGPSSPSSAST